MVTVFFNNGQRVELPAAVQVRPGILPGTESEGHSLTGIVCLDAEDKEVGVFRHTEIVGYAVHTGRNADAPRAGNGATRDPIGR